MRRIVIGTRGSELALWQANHVRSALLAAHAGLAVEIEIIRTKGDRILDKALHQMLDKGLFTKEIESALLAGAVDLAVHSLKDLPTELPEGLVLAAVTEREDPADLLIAKSPTALDDLPRGASVLTGSLRRAAQILHQRPDIEVRPVRGNVATRLRKLDESDADAIVLARAGLVRLGLLDRPATRLDPAEFLPACGQGALGIEIRSDDGDLAQLLYPLNDATTRAAVTAERAFLADLGGGCQAPCGAYVRPGDDEASFEATGMVASLDGRRLLRRSVSAAPGQEPQAIGRALADALRQAGCIEILDRIAADEHGLSQEPNT